MKNRLVCVKQSLIGYKIKHSRVFYLINDALNSHWYKSVGYSIEYK